MAQADAEADLAARLEALPALVNGDAWLVHRGRFVTLALRLDLGTISRHVTIEHGRIEAVERGPFLMRAFAFAVRGSASGWRQFWQPCPPGLLKNPPIRDSFLPSAMSGSRS